MLSVKAFNLQPSWKLARKNPWWLCLECCPVSPAPQEAQIARKLQSIFRILGSERSGAHAAMRGGGGGGGGADSRPAVVAPRTRLGVAAAALPRAPAAPLPPLPTTLPPGSSAAVLTQHAVSYVEQLKSSVAAADYASVMAAVRGYKRGELAEAGLIERVATLLAASEAPLRVCEGFTAFLSQTAQPLFLARVRAACGARAAADQHNAGIAAASAAARNAAAAAAAAATAAAIAAAAAAEVTPTVGH